MKKNLLLLTLIGSLFVACSSPSVEERPIKNRALALTPPMGWNSWNTIRREISDSVIRQIVDIMVASGMQDAGYEYIVLDDFWLAPQRDSAGNLQGDPDRFPHGMAAIGEYIHQNGFKFGIYNCGGRQTCGGLPGMYGHEEQDVATFASWGVDYLKVDFCFSEGIDAREEYTKIAQALSKVERPIVFSICDGGENNPWEWGGEIGHLWRTTWDIGPRWKHDARYVGSWHELGIVDIIDRNSYLREYNRPGAWNDPDMLEVGHGLTDTEGKAHFSMWAMLAAPLMAGNDLRKMTDETISILTNKEVIAVDQDSLGYQAMKYKSDSDLDIWVKPLQHDDWAVCFLNRAEEIRTINFEWTKYPIRDRLAGRILDASEVTYRMRDLWRKEWVGTTDSPIVADIAPHDVLMLRLTPVVQ